MPIEFEDKNQSLPEIKKAVAFHVWERFISKDANPRILIDAGSSAQAVAEVIVEQFDKINPSHPTKLIVPTVFTHNHGAWLALSKSKAKIDLYLIGGRFNQILNAIIDPGVFEAELKLWSPNISIIAVSGIDEHGLYCSNIQDEYAVKKLLAEKEVERRLVLCDHSKIGRTDVRMFISLKNLKMRDPEDPKGADCGEVYLITDKYDRMKIKPEHLRSKYKKTIEALESVLGKDQVIQVVTAGPV